jgi:hypothetical protein
LINPLDEVHRTAHFQLNFRRGFRICQKYAKIIMSSRPETDITAYLLFQTCRYIPARPPSNEPSPFLLEVRLVYQVANSRVSTLSVKNKSNMGISDRKEI